jgi:hypothetical protein
MAVTTKRTIFWDVTSCIMLEVYRRFGGRYCLHLLGVFVVCLFGLLFGPKYGGNMFRWTSENLYPTTRRHIPEYSSLHCYGSQVKVDEVRETRTTHERDKKHILIGKPESKTVFRRPTLTRIWEENIKTSSKEIRRKDVGCSHLVQVAVRWRALVDMIMNLPAP